MIQTNFNQFNNNQNIFNNNFQNNNNPFSVNFNNHINQNQVYNTNFTNNTFFNQNFQSNSNIDKLNRHKIYMENLKACFDYKSIELNGSTKIINYYCDFKEFKGQDKPYEMNRMISICNKDEFKNYSFEEIRMIDYIIKRKNGGFFNRNNNEFNSFNNFFNTGNSNPFCKNINNNNASPSPFTLVNNTNLNNIQLNNNQFNTNNFNNNNNQINTNNFITNNKFNQNIENNN